MPVSPDNPLWARNPRKVQLKFSQIRKDKTHKHRSLTRTGDAAEFGGQVQVRARGLGTDLGARSSNHGGCVFVFSESKLRTRRTDGAMPPPIGRFLL